MSHNLLTAGSFESGQSDPLEIHLNDVIFFCLESGHEFCWPVRVKIPSLPQPTRLDIKVRSPHTASTWPTHTLILCLELEASFKLDLCSPRFVYLTSLTRALPATPPVSSWSSSALRCSVLPLCLMTPPE